MASFRKPPIKTRAALESSTALPPEPADVLSHVGEDAAKLTGPAKSGKSKAARKGAGSAPSQVLPHPLADARPNSETATPIVEPAEAAAIAAPVESAVADFGQTAASVSEAAASQNGGGAVEEIREVAVDLADQAVHAGIDAAATAVDLAADTQDQTAEIAQRAADAFGGSPAPVPIAAMARSPVRGSVPGSHALVEINVRLADYVCFYVEDSIDFITGLVKVRTLPDILALNSRHVQRRLDAMAGQTRDLAMLAGKLADEAMFPFMQAGRQ